MTKMKMMWMFPFLLFLTGGCEDEADATPVATSIAVSPATATIAADSTQQFTATVSDQNGDTMADVSVTWSSSDESVATVDATGLATGVYPGSADITASAESISGSATATVPSAIPDALVGTWTADSTQGDLGSDIQYSGSLAGAGWTEYSITFNADGTFSSGGTNALWDVAPYGDDDGAVSYSGTVTVDEDSLPKWIDLTATESNNTLWSTDGAVQPLQNGIYEINSDGTELTIQYGAILIFGIPRPTEFLVDSTGAYDCGTLIKQ